MFETLVCCLKGIWVHPYTVTPTKLAPDLGILGPLWTVKMVKLHHGWGWYPPKTASHILIRHIQSVWAIGMLSQGCMVAPLYPYTGQVGPRFGKSGSLVEWKWCHNIMVEADIHLRPLHTSKVDICKVFKPLVCCLKVVCVHPYTVTPAMLAPDLGSRSLVEWKWCHNVMVEADIHFRLLHTSILDIYKVFETFVCCLKGIWMHPYTVTLAKIPPDFGIRVHLSSGNDATTSLLRMIFTSYHFIHPY